MIALFRKFVWWLRPGHKERELREELQFHLDEETSARVDAGVREDEARSAARRDLGNEARVREEVRAIWTWRPLDELTQDVRYAGRTLVKNRVVTIFAALSLALGIGATTAICSFMDALLFRALPVSDPGSLVVMQWQSKPINFGRPGGGSDFVMHSISGSTYRTSAGVEAQIFPFTAFERLRDVSAPVLSDIFARFAAGRLNVMIGGEAELTDAEYVSGDFFRGLGAPPAAGRLLHPDDDAPGAPPVAVITSGYAERRFGAAPDAVGRPILVNNLPFTVVGVTARGFSGVDPGMTRHLYLPMQANRLFDPGAEQRNADANYYWLGIMGRLRPGVTLEGAQATLAPAFERWVRPTATTDQERANLPVLGLTEGAGGLGTLRRRYAKPLYLLLAMGGLILAIACANTANLLLARAAARQREIAVRLSIGAGRFRLVRQLLTESLVLSIVGGGLGVLVAVAGTRMLTAWLATGGDGLRFEADLNWRVLAVAAALSMACGMLFGLAPAVQSSRPDLVPALKDSGAGLSRSLGRRLLGLKVQHGLVVAQIALLLLLLVGAGLFARTLSNLQSIPLGFNPERLLLFDVNAAQAGHPESHVAAFYAEVRQRLAEMPGVRAVTLSHSSLLRAGRGHPIRIDGRLLQGSRFMQTGPAFFGTMQIPILQGREIDERDHAAGRPVAVISDAFAKSAFPNQNPLGRRIAVGGSSPMEVEVVGVAATAHYGRLKSASPPVIYVSYPHVPVTQLQQMTYALRTDGDPLAHVNTVRQIVHNADPRVPVSNVRTQAGEIDQILNQEIVLARLCTAYAVIALVIACVGLYGTMAHTVVRRTREIGIRIALGARRRGVIWMVVREVCVLALLGLLVSIPIARALSKFVASFLFEMQPDDPQAIAIALTALLAATVLASYGPARRAARIDPTTALRHE